MTADLSAIPVADVCKWLHSEKQSLLEGVCRGQYAFWLGSAISFGRVPGLKRIIRTVLEHLRGKADLTNPRDDFTQALSEIVQLSELPEYADPTSVDFSKEVQHWQRLDELLLRLSANYSKVFGTPVGSDHTYLLWKAARFLDEFANAADPCDEHLCLAILASQGAVSQLVSGNWDPLIEDALESTDPGAQLAVCVTAADLHNTYAGQPRLLKFHGCARKAKEDEHAYAPYLVVTDDQIRGYADDGLHGLMFQTLVTLACERNTLMIGLSAQDSDILDVFRKSATLLRQSWRTDPPRLVFSGARLTPDQRTIVKLTYTPQKYSKHRQAIDDRSTIAAYSGPLLKGLVLSVELKKLTAHVACCIDYFDAPDVTDRLATQLERVFGWLATWADLAGANFVTDYVALHGSLVGQFSASPGGVHRGYVPLDRESVHRIQSRATRTTDGVRELAAAIALLGAASQRGARFRAEPTAGAAEWRAVVRSSSGTTQVQFAANDDVVTTLIQSGRLDQANPDHLVVTSTSAVAYTQRHPGRGGARRGGRPRMRQVSMRDLLGEASTYDEILDEFLRGAAL